MSNPETDPINLTCQIFAKAAVVNHMILKDHGLTSLDQPNGFQEVYNRAIEESAEEYLVNRAENNVLGSIYFSTEEMHRYHSFEDRRARARAAIGKYATNENAKIARMLTGKDLIATASAHGKANDSIKRKVPGQKHEIEVARRVTGTFEEASVLHGSIAIRESIRDRDALSFDDRLMDALLPVTHRIWWVRMFRKPQSVAHIATVALASNQ